MIPVEGTWKVERLGGVLPPMVGVWKRIRGGHGETWIGRLTLFGRELGTFRMTPIDYPKETRDEEEKNVDQQGKLRRKLVEYVQNVHAMEQNVLLMLDSVILNTKDRELADMFRAHK